MLEQTKTKLINLANQKGQFSDSIKIWSNYIYATDPKHEETSADKSQMAWI